MNEDKFVNGVSVAIVVGALVFGGTILGVGIWAIIKLVTWVTGLS